MNVIFDIVECHHRIYPGTVILIGMMFGHSPLDGHNRSTIGGA